MYEIKYFIIIDFNHYVIKLEENYYCYYYCNTLYSQGISQYNIPKYFGQYKYLFSAHSDLKTSI